jgi:hypothetical protein
MTRTLRRSEPETSQRDAGETLIEEVSVQDTELGQQGEEVF